MVSEADVILVLDVWHRWSHAVHKPAPGCKVIQVVLIRLQPFPRGTSGRTGWPGDTADIILGLARAMQSASGLAVGRMPGPSRPR